MKLRRIAFIISQVIFLNIFISCAPPDAREIKEPTYDHWFIKEENNYSPEEWQECLDVLDQLYSLGITKPERFKSLSDAKYIVEQRFNLTANKIDPDRLVTAVLFALIDPNRAFHAEFNPLHKIIEKPRQQLLFFEINGDAACKDALRLLLDNLPYEKELVLILGGHGTQNSLVWDNGSNATVLEPSDYNDPEFTGLLHSLNINLVIFHSCSAGAGGSEQPNQANRMAEHIRIGGKVIAPLIDTHRINIIFNQDDSIDTVTYNKGDAGIEYQVDGSYDVNSE